MNEFHIESDRCELDAPPAYHFDLSRRDFLKSLGGGIAVFILLNNSRAQESGGDRQHGGDHPKPQDISSWLHIGKDGRITVYTGKAEVGQNIRTSLTQVVAEELCAPIAAIQIVMGDTQLTPFDAGTFGSRTTPDMARQLRMVAATARELLIDLAASEWQIDRNASSRSSQLVAADGKIINQETKEALEFGRLTKGQKLTKIIADNPLITPPEQWKIAGQSIPKVNGRAFVTGRHRFASDMKLPGMLYGKVLRPPAFGATLISLDTKEAEAMSGVVVVRDGDFVGVAAPGEYLATRALKSMKAEWNSIPQISSKELFDSLKLEGDPPQRGGDKSNNTTIQQGLSAADIRLDKTYTVAYIAHAPLEPRAALAKWENDSLTVWTGTQRPFGVRGDLAKAFRIPAENVRVIVPDTGSGYGGKHTGEAAVEAARIAKSSGKPVKLVWTREEEFTWAYFRPAGVVEVISGTRKDGTLTGWEFHNYNSGAAGIRTLYEVPNQLTQFHSSRSPLRQGSYRALASTANHFARETNMDELACAIGMDPLAFRLNNVKDPRLRAVFEAAAKNFGWGQKAEINHGFGIAGGSEKGGYIATCAEVVVDRSTGSVQVVRALTAFECGAILNPDHLKNQVEGALMMGLGGALFEAIEFENGKILNPLFSTYRVPRFRDAPQIEVVLLDRKDLPSAGAGEAPIIGIAPAIGNAIFAATGIRLRSLPLATQELIL